MKRCVLGRKILRAFIEMKKLTMATALVLVKLYQVTFITSKIVFLKSECSFDF